MTDSNKNIYTHIFFSLYQQTSQHLTIHLSHPKKKLIQWIWFGGGGDLWPLGLGKVWQKVNKWCVHFQNKTGKIEPNRFRRITTRHADRANILLIVGANFLFTLAPPSPDVLNVTVTIITGDRMVGLFETVGWGCYMWCGC